ncbi:hypothetical protein ACN262_28675 [Burkholderia gladioli]|uniref:hypothetical protein n=1 Tax=Burkholderia gladioli TaxID=28095 RepID=UPI00163EFCCE|nr:hypothetical protein [Burkholderia gladioli]
MIQNKIIDVFSTPYESWSYRKATQQEMMDHYREQGFFSTEIKDRLERRIGSAFEAADHTIRVRVDNALEGFIDRALADDFAFNALRQQMPSPTPVALDDYQSSYPNYDRLSVDQAINRFGVLLADGQYLLHGGCWFSDGNSFTTDRPLSTTFCPQIALRSAEWRGKAYDANRVELMVIRVTQPRTKAYLFGPESELKHEKEAVFASGAHLKRLRENFIMDLKVYKVTNGLNTVEKAVPAFVTEVELS